jgi:hypothetical protein
MNTQIKLLFHKYLSSIRIKWNTTVNDLTSDFEYEVSRSYNAMLRSSMFVMQMAKEELIYNVCRLSTIFNPCDDMYCDLYEIDDGHSTPPSIQLIDLYARLRITLRQWFAKMCVFLDLPVRFANESPILPLYVSPYCDQFKDLFDVPIVPSWEPREHFVITDKDNIIRVLINKDDEYELSDYDLNFAVAKSNEIIDLTNDTANDDTAEETPYVDVRVDLDDVRMISTTFVQLPEIKGVSDIEDTSTCFSEDTVEDNVTKIHMLRNSNFKLKCEGKAIEFGSTPLIWDTGAGDDVFDVIPPGARNFRSVNSSILLGGSTQHEVAITTMFDVGFLRNVLLLPRDMKLGCCIISAGKLRNLRTNQYDWNKFHVVDGNGFIISKGVIGDDRIFYLLDNNLLKRHSAQGSGQPDVSVGIEEHQSRRIDTLQGVDVNRSLYVNRTIDFSNAEATTHNDDDTDTENRERDDFEEDNE